MADYERLADDDNPYSDDGGGKEEEGVYVQLRKSSTAVASPTKMFGNITNALVGGGVLGLPYAIRQSGFLLGIICIVILALACAYTFVLVPTLRTIVRENALPHLQPNQVQYSDIGHYAFGKPGSVIVSFALLSAQLGICVAYLIFIGQNISSLTTGVLEHRDIVLMTYPALFGLSCIRKVHKLAPVSLFSNAACLSGVVVILVYGMTSDDAFQNETTMFEFDTLPLFFGIAAFSFVATASALPMEASIRDKTSFPRVVSLAHMTVALLYMTFGGLSYMMFGSETNEVITKNLGDGGLAIFVKIALSLVVFCTFPVQMFPITMWMDATFVPDPETPHRTAKKNFFRAILVSIIVVTAAFVIKFGLVANIVGSLSLSLIGFIMPAGFHLKMCSNLRTRDIVADAFVLIMGVAGMGTGLYSSIKTVVDGDG